MKLHVSGHWQRKDGADEGFAEVIVDGAAPQSEQDLTAIRAACVAQIKDCGGFVILAWHELPEGKATEKPRF